MTNKSDARFNWPTPSEYRRMKAAVLKKHPHILKQKRGRPKTVLGLVAILVEAVVAQRRRTGDIKARTVDVLARLKAGQDFVDLVHLDYQQQKIRAIWASREALMGDFKPVRGKAAILEWCLRLELDCPGKRRPLGPKSSWLAAKLMGLDVAAPDQWLIKTARAASVVPSKKVGGQHVNAFCRWLARETGDPVATIDTIILHAAKDPSIVRFVTKAIVALP